MENLIIQQLRSSIVRGRLAHAYLFNGPRGSGKRETAKILSKLLNCETVPIRNMISNGSSMHPCESCSSCRKIESNNHPDVRLILPRDDSNSIKIEDIRELQGEISMKPYEGRYKIYTIIDADTMTEEASNCLLKTLEEPPGDALLILTSSNIKMLLSTIISRCQVVKFAHAPGYNEAVSNNVEHPPAAENAIDMFMETLKEPREKIWLFDKDRSEVEDALYILEGWFRDILVIKCGATSRLMNPDRKDEIMKLSRGYSVEGLLNTLDTVEETRGLISQNANVKIALPVMLMKISKIGTGSFTGRSP